MFKDFMRRHGWYNARLDGIDRMSPQQAAERILSEMAKGRVFREGEAAQGEGDGLRSSRENGGEYP